MPSNGMMSSCRYHESICDTNFILIMLAEMRALWGETCHDSYTKGLHYRVQTACALAATMPLPAGCHGLKLIALVQISFLSELSYVKVGKLTAVSASSLASIHLHQMVMSG